MASRGKKKTTMAKLNREAKLRERRLEKQARKDARTAGLGGGPDGVEGRAVAALGEVGNGEEVRAGRTPSRHHGCGSR